MEILRVENLNFSYPETETAALSDVSFSINAGDFTVLCGRSGCGKTTLLRLLKKELSPVGNMRGEIYFRGRNLTEIDAKTSAAKIGFVMQNPESQTVTDKVWHELAFGLENSGLPTGEIRRRVAETASYFGISDWFRKRTDELSGGQKQILALASVMVMRPDILLLDEPTSQLDPIAAEDFISTLRKLNRELGITVITAEHRLEEIFPVADKVIVMDGGKLGAFDIPERIGTLLPEDHPIKKALPSATRIALSLGKKGDLPLTVRDGKTYLEENFGKAEKPPEIKEYTHSDEKAIELKNVWFRYEKDLPDILRGLTFSVYKGEIFSVLGGNGVGKTTALNVISGLAKAYRGKTLISGKKVGDYKNNSLYRRKLAFLPQDPQTVFVKDTLKADFEELLKALDVPKDKREEKILSAVEKTGTEEFLTRHPFDLSGGEMQKAALTKMLLTEPEILLLDEPTKGLDAFSKENLKNLIFSLRDGGLTVLEVTHDIEFAAEISDRCALFFDGEIVSADVPEIFFAGNDFYTTAANRIARGLYKNAVTCEQVVSFCRGNEK